MKVVSEVDVNTFSVLVEARTKLLLVVSVSVEYVTMMSSLSFSRSVDDRVPV